MRAFYDPRQRLHDPQHFLSSGSLLRNPERPERAEVFLRAIKQIGLTPELPEDTGLRDISAVHSPDYLEFLQNIYRRWQYIDNASDEVIPNVHPNRHVAGYPKSAVGQAGYHQADTACPISAKTWQSAYWSAQTAIAGANCLLLGERSAYALCRPPGHHAFHDMAGGFCFLNNAAIAATRFVSGRKSVAILDVDVHHGNGTQGIFYRRPDVLTVSLHADPRRFYPFFWGYEQERGEGRGLGANYNLPLPRGTDDEGFLAALQHAKRRIRAFCPDALVVALGLDAFQGDPLAGLAVTSSGFSKIGAEIAKLDMPTLFVQEGGYLCPDLGRNLACVLEGFSARN